MAGEMFAPAHVIYLSAFSANSGRSFLGKRMAGKATHFWFQLTIVMFAVTN
jgi:hypothetical protein